MAETRKAAGWDVAPQGSGTNYRVLWICNPTGVCTWWSPNTQNTAERQEDVTTLTQDGRGAEGCLEDNEHDQSFTHKGAQGSMAATFLMNKIVQNLAKYS